MSIFDKYVHGDGNEVALPNTRAKSFVFYGKKYFLTLIIASVLGSLFFAPSLAWLYVMNFNKAQFIASLDATSESYAATLAAYLRSFTLTTYSALILGAVLFFLGLAGVFSVVKRACFGENATVKHFFEGIRQNGLRFCLFGFVWGVAYFLFRMNLLFVGGAVLATFVRVTAAVSFLLVNVIIMYCCMQTVVYNVKLLATFKNAVVLTFAKFFQNVGVLVVFFAPYLITLLIPSPFQLLALLALSFCYLGFATLFVGCYCNGVFDKTINPKLGEEFVRRGLRKQ